MSEEEVVQLKTRGILYASTSFLVALLGIGLAFLPWGYGFVTIFLSAGGVILGGKAAQQGATQLGRWASMANVLPILTYIGYMMSYAPVEVGEYHFNAEVIETGRLADQSVFDEDVQAAGAITGIRMNVSPCQGEFIVRVTGKPNSHLGIYIPTQPTRECLAKITSGQTLDLTVLSTARALTGEIKSYRFSQIGPCVLEEVDMGAVIHGTACPSWF